MKKILLGAASLIAMGAMAPASAADVAKLIAQAKKERKDNNVPTTRALL